MKHAVIIASSCALLALVSFAVALLKNTRKTQRLVKEFNNDISQLKGRYVTKSEKRQFLDKHRHTYNFFSSWLVFKTQDVKECIARYEGFSDAIGNANATIIEQRKSVWRLKRTRSVVESFGADLNILRNHYITRVDAKNFLIKHKRGYNFLKLPVVRKTQEVENCIAQYENFYDLISNLNADYIRREKDACRKMFDNVAGYSLDEQQKGAIVTDETHSLVIAGAGSGKTLTIAGKVKYLYERQKIRPEDILLITFTNKAVDEMNDRINGKLEINTQATTFHRLGLNILKANSDFQLDIVEGPGEFIDKYFKDGVIKNPRTMKKLLKYFAYYVTAPANLEEFNSVGEAYEYEKTADFETIRSKYQQSRFLSQTAKKGKAEKKTIEGEAVKSLDELEIANFLFLNGIKYEYEPAYPFEAEDTSRRVYHPDFYLPEYDIWLEHFGINKEGRTPWLPPVEEQKYLKDMEWKREFHKKNGTRLLETYHYYSSEGRLLEELEKILKENDVKFVEPDFVKIFSQIYGTETERYLAEFKNLCCTFLTLFKSNGFCMEDLDKIGYKDKKRTNPYYTKKLKLFKEIIRPIMTEYQNYLDDRGAVDFSDMINKAAEAVADGARIHNYAYVIVDEYQDVSVAQYRLIKSILDRTGAHLFCVGDDWQSIYRFAGSDIALFTEFERRFGYSVKTALRKTYRNSTGLISEAGDFVMQNPTQLRKVLYSTKDLDYPIVFVGHEDSPTDALRRAMDEITQTYGPESSIMLLGRTQHDFKIIQESALFKISKDKSTLQYHSAPNVPVTFLTTHKAKGLEADNVILLNFENKMLGFPNKIADDPILELVLSSKEVYRYAEERRLFYVALTRTKNKVFILTNTNSPSEFLREFASSQNARLLFAESVLGELRCPRCHTGHLVVRVNEQNGKNFFGCSNYPRCEYTLNELSIKEDPHICPECGGYMVRRSGKYNEFYQCTNAPYCDYKEPRLCPECGSKLKKRSGPYGTFIGCANYSKCSYKEKVANEP